MNKDKPLINRVAKSGIITINLEDYFPKEDILEFDIDGYFEALDLERHITPTRGNGLRAIVSKIQHLAKENS